MFAVIKTGGKQYRVAEKDVITIDKVKGDPGDLVEFAEVLILGGDNVLVGTPTVAGASVAGEMVEQTRDAKVIAFKKRRRKNSRRKRGHRQELSVIRITEILTDGRKPTHERPRPAEASPEPAAAPTVEGEAPAPSAETEAAEAEAAPTTAPPAAKKPAKTAARKPAAAKTASKGKDKNK